MALLYVDTPLQFTMRSSAFVKWTSGHRRFIKRLEIQFLLIQPECYLFKEHKVLTATQRKLSGDSLLSPLGHSDVTKVAKDAL